MGVYAHRFIEILDKDNKWQLLPLWNKYKENSYSQPDVVAEDLKLTKNPCFLSRASSGLVLAGDVSYLGDRNMMKRRFFDWCAEHFMSIWIRS